MPPPTQPFAAPAQEEEEPDEIEDSHTGGGGASSRQGAPCPQERPVSKGRSEPDGQEWHRPYDAARRHANMAVSTADVVAVDIMI